MNFIRKILFPIVPIYYLVTWLRNKFYDLGLKSSTSFTVPIICVGNLSVGGTGKTPMIEYLIRLLREEYKVATLSRGYMRKTQGFQLADKGVTSEDLGDEPFQFYRKFGSSIDVAVDTNRVNGVKRLMKKKGAPDIILLDDAFQHRKVKAGFNIMLTTYGNPFYNDMVLPTGDLREPRSGYKRADVIIVTKCPETLSDTEKVNITKKINPLKTQDVFFSSISYAKHAISETSKKLLENFEPFTLVTGIANATPLVNFLKSKKLGFDHLKFKDHHEFSNNDISSFESLETILTTEKDFMRLKQYKSLEDKLFYLPITVNISEHEKFNDKIKTFVKSF